MAMHVGICGKSDSRAPAFGIRRASELAAAAAAAAAQPASPDAFEAECKLYTTLERAIRGSEQRSNEMYERTNPEKGEHDQKVAMSPLFMKVREGQRGYDRRCCRS